VRPRHGAIHAFSLVRVKIGRILWLLYHSLALDERDIVDNLGSNGQMVTEKWPMVPKVGTNPDPLPQFVDLKTLLGPTPRDF
jgi:hypothetical protein